MKVFWAWSTLLSVNALLGGDIVTVAIHNVIPMANDNVTEVATGLDVSVPVVVSDMEQVTVMETATSSIERGKFLNFDEIDDLFHLHKQGQRHHMLQSNSTWRHPAVSRRKHRRHHHHHHRHHHASEDAASTVGFQTLEHRVSPNGNYEIIIGNLRNEAGDIVGENVIVKRLSDGYVFSHSNYDEGDAVRLFGARDGSAHSLHSAQVGDFHPTDDYNVDEEKEEDEREIAEMHRRRRMLHGPVTRELSSRTGYVGMPCDDDDGEAERDPDGNISIDLLCACNEQALAYAGDIESLCTAEVEGINLALTNSGVNDVRIRLVGAILMTEANSITALTKDDIKTARAMMLPLRNEYGADILSMWVRAPDSDDRGRGYVNSYANIMEVHALSTLRHEVGHNAGMHHCPEDDKYNDHWVGWLQPETERGTIMCGQDIAMYANPYLTDGGFSVGSASVANAVDAWRSNAAKMSAYVPAVIPYNHEKRVELLRTTLTWKHSTGEVASFVVPDGAERVTVIIAAKPEMLKDYPFLYVRKNKAPTNSKYDYMAVPDGHKGTRNNAYVHMKSPSAGTYYVMAESYKDHTKIVWDLVVYSFGTDASTSSANLSDLPTSSGSSSNGYPGSSISDNGDSNTSSKDKEPSSSSSSSKDTASSSSSSSNKDKAPSSNSSSKDNTSNSLSSEYPEWDAYTTYKEPCTKVTFEGEVYANGWYSVGESPAGCDEWGVWRIVGSKAAHSYC